MTRWGAKEPAAIAGASLARALTLTVFGPDLLASYRLPVQSEVIIGRAAEARVRIPHPSISRQHAKLHLGTSLFVEDLGSSNGTHVAGCRLARGERRLVALGEPVEM